jgi:hypothetical protein
VVVFLNALSQVRQGQQLTLQGKAVAVEDDNKYLGLMFGTGRVLLSSKLEKTAARKGAAALAAVYGMFHSLHIQ